MATSNAAVMLGLETEMGSLAVGMPADIVSAFIILFSRSYPAGSESGFDATPTSCLSGDIGGERELLRQFRCRRRFLPV